MADLLYEGARILREADVNSENFRDLVNSSKYEDQNVLYNLCRKVVKHRKLLRILISACPELEHHERFSDDPYLLLILVDEFLYGPRGLNRYPIPLRKILERHRSTLTELMNQLESFKLLGSFSKHPRPPRFARVNTLKCTLEQVIEWLEEDGCKKIEAKAESREEYRKQIKELKVDEFLVDPDVENLVVFAAGSDLYDYRLVAFNCLILQNKSSCLPAACLAPSPNDVVMDICAAPGLKTSQLAALMENKGQIFAIDVDFQRIEAMEHFMKLRDVKCAEIICEDFLTMDLNVDKYQKVTHVLIDPPSTASGIVDHADVWTDAGKDSVVAWKQQNQTALSLGNFQLAMLKKVFESKLPELRRVVYTTCSLDARENEAVVEEALEVANANGFKLVNAMEKWEHRGKKKYEIGKKCVRANYGLDATNGVFVAVFEKV